jgi:hypothetical protein
MYNFFHVPLWLAVMCILCGQAFAAAPEQPAKKTPAPVQKTVQPEAPPPAPAPAALNPDDFCRGRQGCRLLWSQPVGHDANNRDMILSEITIPQAADAIACHRPQDTRFGEFLNKVEQEIWLTVQNGMLTERRKLLSFCNNGYGAKPSGEDRLDITDNRLVHRRFGGGEYRWMTGETYRLPEFDIIQKWGCSTDADQGGGGIHLYDYTNGAFRTGWSDKAAAEEEAGDHLVDCAPLNVEQAKTRYKGLPVKQVQSFLGIKLGDVKQLGNCATVMTTAPGPHQGYVVYGQPDNAAAELRMLRVNDDRLWVDVRDEGRSFHSSTNWRNDDRLEIWWLEQALLDKSGQPRRRALRQFFVRLADLRVFPGAGYEKLKLPEVERRESEARPNILSLVIRWPMEQFPANRMTVAYARSSEAGDATKVIWATSTLKAGDPYSLGPVVNMQQLGDNPAKSCIVKDGVLELVLPEK